MNAKEETAPLRGAALSVTGPQYHRYNVVQATRWWIEAERLGQEYRRTRQQRHLEALARHLDGVFERLST